MKSLALVLMLVSCEDAHVLSSDGTKRLGYCTSDRWVKCVSDLCPQGYVVVVHSAESIIKCNDVSDAGQPCKDPK